MTVQSSLFVIPKSVTSMGVRNLTSDVLIWISGSTQDLLDTYKMNQGNDYDGIIRRLVFCEKLELKLYLFEVEIEEEQ